MCVMSAKQGKSSKKGNVYTVKVNDNFVETSAGVMVWINFWMTKNEFLKERRTLQRTCFPVYSPTVHTPISDRRGRTPSSSQVTVHGLSPWQTDPCRGLTTLKVYDSELSIKLGKTTYENPGLHTENTPKRKENKEDCRWEHVLNVRVE